jgi:serine/threonine-protein kinase
MSLTAGTRLGSYEIVSLLGSGGMGEVYKAKDTKLGRDVAIKVLPEEVASDRERLRRFEQEARSASALNHPNIITIYDIGEQDRIHYIAMEYVAGKTLGDLIPANGMTLDRFLQIAVPLADGLAAAHQKGIVHRDLKPGNVMLSDEARVKILDFGLAKLVRREDFGSFTAPEAPTVSRVTRTGTVMGTMGYMAPEHLRGERTDERSDIFSLGVLLYEMATGVRPFRAPTSPDVISEILRDTPQPVDQVRPGLPHDLGRIIRRCLEKEPGHRFQTALDVHNELADLVKELQSQEIVEAAERTRGVTWPKTRRRWLGTAAVVAASVVAVVLVLLKFDQLRELLPTDASPEIGSLAVLPFDNLMNDPEQDYFVEGMHDALITRLSKLGDLRVISRTSAMRYRATEKTIPEIADELGVDALIEGSVLRAGDRVRITAQLIHGETDEHLWADSYDRDLQNVLTLLSEVAGAIAGEIEIALTPEQRERLAVTSPVDPAAQDAYLKGRYFFNRGTGDNLRKALDQYHLAVESDPTYALAHAGVAAAHLLLGAFGHVPLKEAAPQARAAALKALELDDGLAEAHAILGWVKLYFDWDWPGAARTFEKALELNPNHTYARHGYGDYLTVMGRPEEGLEHVRRGRLSDPASPLAVLPATGHLILARRYDQAIEECRTLLELDPRYPSVRSFYAEALWHRGLHEEALAEYRMTWGRDPELASVMERGYAEAGPRGALLSLAQELAARPEGRRAGTLSIARLFARVGEVDAAFEWLERAYDQRIPQLMLVRADPDFDSLKSDQRLEALARRIGLPE